MALDAIVEAGTSRCPQTGQGNFTKPVHPHTTPETGMAAPGGVKSPQETMARSYVSVPGAGKAFSIYFLIQSLTSLQEVLLSPQLGYT